MVTSLSLDDWRPLLAAGVRAVSPYNSQPWRFRVVEDRLDVFVLRTKNFFLKLQGISPMTLGFLLENMDAAARARGRRLEAEFLGTTFGLDHPVARVRVVPGGEPDPSAMDGVLARRTHREAFRAEPLAPAAREPLTGLLAGLSDGVATARLVEGERAATLVDILADLEALRFGNPKLLTEALEFIRVGREENERHRDGLDADTLALPPRLRRLLPLLRRHPRWVGAVAPFTGHFHRLRQRAFLQGQSGFIAFTTGAGDPAAFVEMGRRIQRTLNALSRAGLDAQCLLSGLYLLHLAFENPEIFSAEEARTLLTCRRDLELLLGVPDHRIAFLIRLGRAERPAPESLRKDLSAFLLV